MRKTLACVLAMTAFVGGCATHYAADPWNVTLEATFAPHPCLERAQDLSVLIEVSNPGPTPLTLYIDSEERPYKLNWLAYNVIDDASGEVDYAHTSDHGPVGSRALRIGPGDSTTVSATLWKLGAKDHGRAYRVRLRENDHDQYFFTNPVRACPSNASSRPARSNPQAEADPPTLQRNHDRRTAGTRAGYAWPAAAPWAAHARD